MATTRMSKNNIHLKNSLQPIIKKPATSYTESRPHFNKLSEKIKCQDSDGFIGGGFVVVEKKVDDHPPADDLHGVFLTAQLSSQFPLIDEQPQFDLSNIHHPSGANLYTERNEALVTNRYRELRESLDVPSLVDKIKTRSSSNVVKSLKVKVVHQKKLSSNARSKLFIGHNNNSINYGIDESTARETKRTSVAADTGAKQRPITAEDQWGFKPLYKHLSSRSTRTQLFKESQMQKKRQEEL